MATAADDIQQPIVTGAFPTADERRQIGARRLMRSRITAEEKYGPLSSRAECDGVRENGEVQSYHNCRLLNANGDITPVDVLDSLHTSFNESDYMFDQPKTRVYADTKFDNIEKCLRNETELSDTRFVDKGHYEECLTRDWGDIVALTALIAAQMGVDDMPSALRIAEREAADRRDRLDRRYRPLLEELLAKRELEIKYYEDLRAVRASERRSN